MHWYSSLKENLGAAEDSSSAHVDRSDSVGSSLGTVAEVLWCLP